MTDWAEECEDLPLMDLPEPEQTSEFVRQPSNPKQSNPPRDRNNKNGGGRVNEQEVFNCATCRLEVNGVRALVQHCQSEPHIRKGGRRGFTGLIANRFGLIPSVSDQIIRDCNGKSDLCACGNCPFFIHRDPPAHFAAADEAFCCSMCRISKGRQHGGHCQKVVAPQGQTKTAEYDNRPMTCRQCGEECKNKAELTIHLKANHPRDSSGYNGGGDDERTTTVQSSTGAVDKTSAAAAAAPVADKSWGEKPREQKPKNFTCRQCQADFTNNQDLMSHLKAEHPKDPKKQGYRPPSKSSATEEAAKTAIASQTEQDLALAQKLQEQDLSAESQEADKNEEENEWMVAKPKSKNNKKNNNKKGGK
jgi:hypothetical protein